MKMRNGFVSNSSSSSFLVIETKEMTKQVRQVLEKIGIKKPWDWEAFDAAGFPDIGAYGGPAVIDDTLCVYDDFEDITLAMDLDEKILNQMTLSQCKATLSNHIESKYGIHIPLNNFKLNYGKRYSE